VRGESHAATARGFGGRTIPHCQARHAQDAEAQACLALSAWGGSGSMLINRNDNLGPSAVMAAASCGFRRRVALPSAYSSGRIRDHA